jgi:hypothetical protein
MSIPSTTVRLNDLQASSFGSTTPGIVISVKCLLRLSRAVGWPTTGTGLPWPYRKTFQRPRGAEEDSHLLDPPRRPHQNVCRAAGNRSAFKRTCRSVYSFVPLVCRALPRPVPNLPTGPRRKDQQSERAGWPAAECGFQSLPGRQRSDGPVPKSARGRPGVRRGINHLMFAAVVVRRGLLRREAAPPAAWCPLANDKQNNTTIHPQSKPTAQILGGAGPRRTCADSRPIASPNLAWVAAQVSNGRGLPRRVLALEFSNCSNVPPTANATDFLLNSTCQDGLQRPRTPGGLDIRRNQ